MTGAERSLGPPARRGPIGRVRDRVWVPRGGPHLLSEEELVDRARLHVPVGGDEALLGLSDRTTRALAVAAASGAPVGPILAAAGQVAAQRASTAAELERVVAPAISVARMLVALPIVVVPLLAMVLDVDLWAFWTRDPLGRIVAVAVVVMIATAALWVRLLVAAATRPATARGPGPILAGPLVSVAGVVAAISAWLMLGWVAGIALAVAVMVLRRGGDPGVADGLDEAADLTAIGVAAGLDLPAALRQAAGHVPDPSLAHQVATLALRLSLDPPNRGATVRAGPRGPGVAPLERLVVDLAITGQPAVAPLRRLAGRLRRAEAGRVQVAVARLPARLTLPTTLLLVPATVLAIGAPIAMRGLQAIAGS